MTSKQKPVTDERVMMEDMKYRSEALTIIAVLLGASIAIALIATFFNYQRYSEKYNGWFDLHLLAVFGVAFVSMVVCNSVVYGLMRLSVHRVQRRIDRQLD